MAFHQYGQFYTDDPAFDIEAYYERVAEAMMLTPEWQQVVKAWRAEAVA